jgi:hypothetical protein
MQFSKLKISAFLLALGFTVSAQAAPTTVSADELAPLSRLESSQYDEVYYDPAATAAGVSLGSVTLGMTNMAERRQFGTRDLERLRSTFEEQLGAQLGSGNLVMDVTLTELIPNIVRTQSGIRTSRYHRSRGIGRASMEAVFRNAATGEVVLVIVDERIGLSLTHNPHAFSQSIWGDASEILDNWAQELPNAL